LTKQIESDKLLFVHRNEVNKVELVTNIICSKMINKY
jgi:hypothetical protein